MPRFFRLLARNPRRYSLQGLIFLCAVLLLFCLAYFVIPKLFMMRYDETLQVTMATSTATKKVFTASHRNTPASVKAIYMTSCVAGTPSLRNNLVKLILDTELNSVVIDIKDYSGRISFVPDDPALKESVSPVCFAPDMPAFIESLHAQGIYAIGRITVFQDPYFSRKHPELAVKRLSDKTALWKDRKGITYLDPGSPVAWRYIVALAKSSYGIGFDELNFDYVRFPSDGNMADIYFPSSDALIAADPDNAKAAVMRDFFAYLERTLRSTQPSQNASAGTAGPVLSADLFGMTTTNTDDLNIGQVLENTLPYFDYVSPMVYPSHYPPNFMGFAKPATKPYEVVKFSMDSAVKRTIATTTVVALLGEEPISTTTKPYLYEKEGYAATKIRPWLQDFNLGATYTAEMVRKQIQATYDSGLDSWMLWNASNRYTKEALLSE